MLAVSLSNRILLHISARNSGKGFVESHRHTPSVVWAPIASLLTGKVTEMIGESILATRLIDACKCELGAHLVGPWSHCSKLGGGEQVGEVVGGENSGGLAGESKQQGVALVGAMEALAGSGTSILAVEQRGHVL